MTKYQSLSCFTKWLVDFVQEIGDSDMLWKMPHPNFDENDHALLEWFGLDGKRLTIYFISPEYIWFLKSWKDGKPDEMEDDYRSLNRSCIDLYKWLWE